MFIDAEAIAALEDWLDGMEGIHEAFGELSAEYHGEIARFGDAWPGSAAQVAGMSATVAEVDRTAGLLRAISPPWRCHIPKPPPADDYEVF